MTKMTVKEDDPRGGTPHPQMRYTIDPVAFAVALIAAPLVVTLLTCWLLIPIVALLVGGPIYLVLELPHC